MIEGGTQEYIGDPAVDDGPSGWPSHSMPFIGRTRERLALRAALEGATRGRGRVLLIAGEPGSGKTRLVAWLARHGLGRGARVLIGRCVAGGWAPPYWPWTQMLRAYSRSVPVETLRSVVGPATPYLVSLAPELFRLLPAAAQERDEESGRFDAFCAFVRGAAAREPVVIILEDIHGADAASLLVLQMLAQEIANEAVLLAATYRDGDLDRPQALADTLGEIVRVPWFQRLVLAPFTDDEVAACLEAVTGGPRDVEIASRILAYTGGNPFFVCELLRQTLDDGGLATLRNGRAPRLPLAVRDFVHGRLSRLSSGARHTIEGAATVGGPFDFGLVAAVLDQTQGDVLRFLDEAAALGLIEAAGAGRERYRFPHLLIHKAVLDGMPPGERLHLVRRAAQLRAARTDDGCVGNTRAAVGTSVFRKDGDYWTIRFADTVTRLKDCSGLRCLSHLLRNPGHDVLALDLWLLAQGRNPEESRPSATSAGPMLDTQAKSAYRRRLEDLREETAEAERCNDPERGRRARVETEFLLGELARGIGLGGRDRTAGDPVERARVNVTRTLRAAVQKLALHDGPLGRHLTATVQTGIFCSYNPDPRVAITWTS